MPATPRSEGKDWGALVFGQRPGSYVCAGPRPSPAWELFAPYAVLDDDGTVVRMCIEVASRKQDIQYVESKWNKSNTHVIEHDDQCYLTRLLVRMISASFARATTWSGGVRS